MVSKVTGCRSIDDEAEEILAILDRPEPKNAAHAARQFVAQARDAGGGGLRQQYLAEAQKHIACLDPRRHGREVQQLQGEVLALQGRGGDTRIAHVTPREMVIPLAMQTPEFVRMVSQYARSLGIDPTTLVVGKPGGRVNPRTGQQEFQQQAHYDGDFAPEIGSIEVVGRRDYPSVAGELFPGDRSFGSGDPSGEAGDSTGSMTRTSTPGSPRERVVVAPNGQTIKVINGNPPLSDAEIDQEIGALLDDARLQTPGGWGDFLPRMAGYVSGRMNSLNRPRSEINKPVAGDIRN